MKVEAVRDDGAVLVTDGQAGAIVLDGQHWVTSRDSALARGNWTPSDSNKLPAIAGLAAQLAARRSEIETAEKRLRPPGVVASGAARSAGHVFVNGVCVTCESAQPPAVDEPAKATPPR